MNRRRHYLIGCAVMLSILVLSYASPNYSQGSTRKATLTIRLKTIDAQGRWAEGIVGEGEMFTRVDVKTGIGYAFTPLIQDRDAGIVQVKMTRIAEGEGQPEVLGEIGIASIKLNESQLMGSPLYTVKVVAIDEHIKEQTVASVASAPGISPASPECCVSCDGERVCASCVALTDCGCCCVCCRGCCSVCE